MTHETETSPKSWRGSIFLVSLLALGVINAIIYIWIPSVVREILVPVSVVLATFAGLFVAMAEIDRGSVTVNRDGTVTKIYANGRMEVTTPALRRALEQQGVRLPPPDELAEEFRKWGET